EKRHLVVALFFVLLLHPLLIRADHLKNSRTAPNFPSHDLRGHIAMTETLECLKKHGQRLDLEIAKEMRLPLATVRQHLTALADRREAIVCKTIQFRKGRQFEAWQGR